jgi:hypothetical protein
MYAALNYTETAALFIHTGVSRAGDDPQRGQPWF